MTENIKETFTNLDTGEITHVYYTEEEWVEVSKLREQDIQEPGSVKMEEEVKIIEL